jgi:hypothetical protein
LIFVHSMFLGGLQPFPDRSLSLAHPCSYSRWCHENTKRLKRLSERCCPAMLILVSGIDVLCSCHLGPSTASYLFSILLGCKPYRCRSTCIVVSLLSKHHDACAMSDCLEKVHRPFTFDNLFRNHELETAGGLHVHLEQGLGGSCPERLQGRIRVDRVLSNIFLNNCRKVTSAS